MLLGTITITQEEYRGLINKSLKYDMLKEMAQKSGYLTEQERFIFGIKKDEEK